MRRTVLSRPAPFLWLGLLLGPNVASAQQLHQAAEAARTWLKFIDASDYSQSWLAAADTVRQSIERERWEHLIGTARDPLGKLISRNEIGVAMPTGLDAGYVIIGYQSSFENQEYATEMVHTTRERDGTWKVSGYFVQRDAEAAPPGWGDPLEEVSKADEERALDASADWLKLLDEGLHGECWEATTSHLRSTVTQEQWEEMLENLDRMFGKNTHRELESSYYTTSLPDAPYGRYFVFGFDSYFQRGTVTGRGGAAGTRIVETVAISDEGAGGWKVAGYYAQLRAPLPVRDTAMLAEMIPEELLESIREASDRALSEGLYDPAIEVAQEWLRLVDEGEYEESWLAASARLREVAGRGDWLWILEAVREPRGELSARDVASVQVGTNVPDVSPGDYLVIEFESSFENGERALETVMLYREAGGDWEISGYVIKTLESQEDS